MDLKGKKIGVALTGSFCTFEKIFKEMEKLAQLGADIYPPGYEYEKHRTSSEYQKYLFCALWPG